MSSKTVEITLNVNQVDYTRSVRADITLIDFLREELNLTGSKKGCDSGECGICTVLVNNLPVLSCIILAVEMINKTIDTIEGISANGPHPIQESMVEHGAIQCGFCTPAMVINGVHLLEKEGKITETEIDESMAGTICRCTGYTKIKKAFRAAEAKR